MYNIELVPDALYTSMVFLFSSNLGDPRVATLCNNNNIIYNYLPSQQFHHADDVNRYSADQNLRTIYRM